MSSQMEVMRRDHPAAPVVKAFWAMREACIYNNGMKESDYDAQCKHPRADHGASSSWCAMDCCPLLIERSRAESVGWD